MEKQITALPKFLLQFDTMFVSTVRNEFSNLNPQTNVHSIDWDYLLFCASILALSVNEEYQAKALRIASSCISYAGVESNHRIAAAVILNRIANTPTIQLAINRKLISSTALKKLPISLLLDRVRSDFKQTILTSQNEVLFLNRFQKQIYEQINSSNWLSISAPTSAGKSFILEFLIEEFLSKNIQEHVCFVVPTRALISQVEGDLIQRLAKAKLGRVHLSSVPQLPPKWREKQLLMVLTQERLNWLINEAPQDFKFGLVLVDEAQKIGDGHRGIVLQQALQTTIKRNSHARIVFSSPLTDNPEVLFRLRPNNVPGEKATSDYIAVNQNMIWVDQVPRKPKEWTLQLCLQNDSKKIGDFVSQEKPPAGVCRLPFIAKSIGGDSGILIYADYASEAEKMANYLYDQLPSLQKISRPLRKLIDLSKKTVHKDYLLVKVLGKGIAFHYGNMPTSLRIEIEKQFKMGRIKYLICTATLIEGVNLGARSIFMRGPRKGRSAKLTTVDFWNLAGRAGRLGADFQGNIVCVDVNQKDVWDFIPPKVRNKSLIRESSDISTETLQALIKYIKDGTPRTVAKPEEFLEYLLSFFLIQLKRDGKISIPSVVAREQWLVIELQQELEAMLAFIDIPFEIIERNIGVSPLAQQNLLKYFQEYKKDLKNLIPCPPASRDALQTSYIKLLSRIFKHLSGHSQLAVFPLGLLVVSWTRGYSLNAIIKRNLKYWLPKGESLPNVIRNTMDDIEDFVRFKFAKYSSCYLDLLRYHFSLSGNEDLLKEVPQLNMWLEFGSSQETQISLMSLGLSRNAAISFSRALGEEHLTREQCAEFIMETSLSKVNIKGSVKEELEHIKDLLMQK